MSFKLYVSPHDREQEIMPQGVNGYRQHKRDPGMVWTLNFHTPEVSQSSNWNAALRYLCSYDAGACNRHMACEESARHSNFICLSRTWPWPS